MRTHPTRFIRLGATVLAGGLIFAACGDDAEDVATDDTTADVADTTADSTADSTPSATGKTIEVTAVDYGFEGLPAEINVGDKLTLTNASTKELHEFVAVRLKDSETRSSAELAKLSEEEFEGIVAEPGPPAAVLLRAPGGAPQIDAVGDGTFSKAGRYFIGCFIPTGADPAAYLAASQQESDGPPDVPGGPPHVANGMHATLVVK